MYNLLNSVNLSILSIFTKSFEPNDQKMKKLYLKTMKSIKLTPISINMSQYNLQISSATSFSGGTVVYDSEKTKAAVILSTQRSSDPIFFTRLYPMQSLQFQTQKISNIQCRAINLALAQKQSQNIQNSLSFSNSNLSKSNSNANIYSNLNNLHIQNIHKNSNSNQKQNQEIIKQHYSEDFARHFKNIQSAENLLISTTGKEGKVLVIQPNTFEIIACCNTLPDSPICATASLRFGIVVVGTDSEDGNLCIFSLHTSKLKRVVKTNGIIRNIIISDGYGSIIVDLVPNSKLPEKSNKENEGKIININVNEKNNNNIYLNHFEKTFNVSDENSERKHEIRLYTINGTEIRREVINWEVRKWATWTNKKGFDFLVVADNNCKLFTYEIIPMKKSRTLFESSKDILALSYISSLQCIVVYLEGCIHFIPFEGIETCIETY